MLGVDRREYNIVACTKTIRLCLRGLSLYVMKKKKKGATSYNFAWKPSINSSVITECHKHIWYLWCVHTNIKEFEKFSLIPDICIIIILNFITKFIVIWFLSILNNIINKFQDVKRTYKIMFLTHYLLHLLSNVGIN